ncbi:tyrosine-type recombinase/integrase [Actinomadura rudentiformis]|uniref:Tyrosine-type recombinase/integrase n=1 Tax=Actinomadura rudentiformis TaxID=359158 RepID=A0A6H9YQF6_9ACTN|nr:tyrosine-type recombinase/integrase [Actinomadura rudentiformis]KAB2343756.1 tyrosine-type recombinase/integrase [Actinomadura rudentiformis]
MAWAEKRGPWYRVRYRDADGVVRTTPDRYRTKTEALDAAEDLDTDHRRGTFIDPHDSRTPLADWAGKWRQTHQVAASTQAKYDHYLDVHIIPAFGHLPLDQIRRSAVKHWAIGLRARYSLATVRGIVTLMSLMLTAAVEERMITVNPIQGLRMTEPRSGHAPRSAIREVRKRQVPTGDQVLDIADRVKILGGEAAQVMVITAAFTGMRWGEITGLSKRNCHLDQLYLQVDPETGALHEVRGAMWLGPPKTQTAGRRIDLPPFLTELLQEVMDGHDQEQGFVTADGRWHRRSNFARRLWRPACDGDTERDWSPVLPGAVFHGLRHHHKTMLDELGVGDAVKFERMGHRMPGIAGVYSHVSDQMRQDMRNRLQERWTDMTDNRP